jgi:hypothetical protein
MGAEGAKGNKHARETLGGSEPMEQIHGVPAIAFAKGTENLSENPQEVRRFPR